MTAYEMMLSESQERMLMVLKPGREAEAEAIFHKWELDFAVIGEVTDTGRMVLVHKGETVCDIPLGPLADEAPKYDRPHISQDEYKVWAGIKPLEDIPESTDIAADLLKLMASPDIASRRWIWEQYDHMVGADTVQRPGGDAAVVRVHGTQKGLAITTDCTPRYCYADPVEGGKQAIAEAYRNLCAVGATPLAVTNCLNFGNPQRPEIMAQFVGCLEGMAEACRALDFPIVSGNVSLYNESKATGGGSAILPTPAIGGVGLLQDWSKSATIGFKGQGQRIVLVTGDDNGSCSAWGEHLGQSLWMREILGQEDGHPPSVDLRNERGAGEVIREMIERGLVTAVHDVSDGGILVAVAEMALASGIGAELSLKYDDSKPQHVAERSKGRTAALFGEDQARYIVTLNEPDDLDGIIELQRYCNYIGSTGGQSIVVKAYNEWSLEQLADISLADLRAAHEGFFPKLMGADAALA
jgi:phosphoribosylformylglycinamidine synthase